MNGRTIINGYRAFSLASLALFSSVSLGADKEAAEVEILGIYFTPSLVVQKNYITNLFYQPSSSVSSRKTVVAPSVKATAQIGLTDMELNYRHESGSYSESSNDNYSDNELFLLSSVNFNRRNQLDIGAKYGSFHQDRGQGLSQGSNVTLFEEPVTFRQTDIYGEYIYGSDSSRGRLVFNLGHSRVRYINFRELTLDDDYTVARAGTSFSARLGLKSRFVLDMRLSEVDYRVDPPEIASLPDSLDRQSKQLLAGLTWRASGKTGGSVMLGARRVSFEDSDRGAFTGPSWEASIDWQPSSYSTLSVTSSREDKEPFGEASYVESSEFGLIWVNYWSKRFSSSLSLDVRDSEYIGSSSKRLDRENSAVVSFSYNMYRWLELGFLVSHMENDSNVDLFDFERGDISFYLDASL